MKTTKTITRTLTVKKGHRYDRDGYYVTAHDSNRDVDLTGFGEIIDGGRITRNGDLTDVGVDWEDAGYSWRSDVEPTIRLVVGDGIEREITMQRTKIVYVLASKGSTEDMVNRTGFGADEI